MYAENERHGAWVDVVIGMIGVVAIVAILFAGYFFAQLVGKVLAATSDRNAEAECIELAKEAKDRLPLTRDFEGGFYITKWQDDMCRSVNIHVDAPVL